MVLARQDTHDLDRIVGVGIVHGLRAHT
jgi:hypothetical protein